MNKHRLVIITMLVIAVNACQSNTEPTESSDTIPIRAAWHEHQCLSDTARIEPIRNAAVLARWWQPFSRQQFPAKPLPPSLTTIDFDQSMVFIVFMGSRPTAGYDIELHDDQALVQGAALTIPATWKEPARDAMVAQILTSPCVLITVPAKGYETVTIRDQQGNSLLEAHFPPE